jgi:hypothetical protein
MRVAGHGQIRAGSGLTPKPPFAAGNDFLDRCPAQYANTTLFGRARSTHFHITFLVGQILDRTLWMLDKMRMPLFGCGDKAALFAGPK